MGLALLAGLVYLIRPRSVTSEGRNGIQAYLDDKKELDVNQKVIRVGVSRPLQASEQGLVELQHQESHPAVEID